MSEGSGYPTLERIGGWVPFGRIFPLRVVLALAALKDFLEPLEVDIVRAELVDA
jgi:hypothetical protein